jgi:glycosyltransferase involved in cell wall biosynthesis
MTHTAPVGDSTPTLPSVLQVVTRRQLRGAEVFAGQLSQRLATAGHPVRLVGLYPPGEPPLETPGVPTGDLSPRILSGVSPRLVLRLAAEIRRFEPQVLQANGSDTLKYSVLARRISGRRPVLLYRNISLASRWVRTPLHRLWNRRLLHAVDHVVAVSERSRTDLEASYGLSEDRITVIPRAVETRFAEPEEPPREALVQATGCDPSSPVIVHVGSFTPEKNHRGMVEVLRLVHKSHGDVQLVFFGDGPLRSEIRAEVEHRGLGDRVFFPGTLPEAAELTEGADLLLLFSLVEGMPGVVLEAGARGVPVVVSDVGGVRELVLDGDNGWLVPAGDTVACADAIRSLLDNASLRCRMGESLRSTVRAHYDLGAITERYRALYRSLSSEDPRP